MIISIEDRDRALTVERLLDGLEIDVEIDRQSICCGGMALCVRIRLLFEEQVISTAESFVDCD